MMIRTETGERGMTEENAEEEKTSIEETTGHVVGTRIKIGQSMRDKGLVTSIVIAYCTCYFYCCLGNIWY